MSDTPDNPTDPAEISADPTPASVSRRGFGKAKERIAARAEKTRKRVARKALAEKTAEEIITGELVPTVPALAASPVQPDGQFASAVMRARARMENDAEFFVRAHKRSIRKSLASNDPRGFETARKGAEWAMEKISRKRSDGSTERIVDTAKAEDSGNVPRIQIGIALGGMPAHSTPALPEPNEPTE